MSEIDSAEFSNVREKDTVTAFEIRVLNSAKPLFDRYVVVKIFVCHRIYHVFQNRTRIFSVDKIIKQ